MPEATLVLFSQLRSRSDVLNPKWKGGDVGGSSRNKGIFFSGLLWLMLQLCKYVRRHFSKHVFMSLTVNAPFLKFYNMCYLINQSTGCNMGSDNSPGEGSHEILTWAER